MCSRVCVCTGVFVLLCVCVFYNIYFVQRGSCLFSACLHFVLLHVIIVVAAAVSLQRHRQTCVAVCLATFLPLPLSLYISLLSLCVCVLSARQLCAVYARLGHTHLAAAEAAAAPRAAQFLHLLQISNGFLCSPFAALPLPLSPSHSFTYFLRFCTRNSLRLRLRFVTLWPGIIWLWLWLWPWLHPHALDKYLLDLYLYCLFCGANCLTLAPSPFLPPSSPFIPLSLCSLPFSFLFCQQLCSWLEQIVMPCLPNTLPRLFCNTQVCECCLPHATCNCSSSSNCAAAAAHCGHHYYGWLFGCHRAVC